MKNILIKIITASMILLGGCITIGNNRSDTIGNTPAENNETGIIDGKLRPFVDKTIRDENVHIGIPIYKF